MAASKVERRRFPSLRQVSEPSREMLTMTRVLSVTKNNKTKHRKIYITFSNRRGLLLVFLRTDVNLRHRRKRLSLSRNETTVDPLPLQSRKEIFQQKPYCNISPPSQPMAKKQPKKKSMKGNVPVRIDSD
ncbi:unnamed protein product [Larinioides sclopetarius]|uniref:Ribosomal protein S10 n=1 Tax=Larinioides sclopetarius TaxID=280406 RepID=A0AAV1YR94_9ARAC